MIGVVGYTLYVAKGRSAPPDVRPAANALPASTPAPLHDIAGPVSYFPYPIWMVALAALAALALLGLLVWFFGFRRRGKGKPSPREVARSTSKDE